MPRPSKYFLSAHVANLTGYRSEKLDIPFFVEDDGTIKVKILYDSFAGEESFESELSQVKNVLSRRLMLHYYPEYYSFLYPDQNNSIGNVTDPKAAIAFNKVKGAFENALTAIYFKPLDPALKARRKDVVVGTVRGKLEYQLSNEDRELAALSGMPMPLNGIFRTEDPLALKRLLQVIDSLPNIDDAIARFNADQKISNIANQTVLILGPFINNNNLLNDGMASFQQQLNGFEGSLPVTLDFNAMQGGMMAVLNTVILDAVVNELMLLEGSEFIEFADTDSIIMYFGTKTSSDGKKKTAIGKITYIVNERGFEESTLATGYMSNVKYNKDLQDPLVLATLKNYEFLVDSLQFARDTTGEGDFSFFDFIQQAPSDFGEGFDATVWDDLPTPGTDDSSNMFLKEAARLGIVDGDGKALERGFIDSMSPAEMRKWRQEVSNNPVIYQKVFAANKAKVLRTAINVTNVVDQVLAGNFNGIKGDSQIGRLLSSIGIDELAKEALNCATFGTAPAARKINNAIRSSINTVGQSLYIEPPPPTNGITVPAIDIGKTFQTFTVDGNLWKEIQKVMVDSLQKAVFEIITGLAKTLKELCPLTNPRSTDFGATNMADLVNSNLTDAAANIPAISNQSALDQLFDKINLTNSEIMNYLSDLSVILSSMEICALFTNRDQLNVDTVEKILDFNSTYRDLNIRTSLNTYVALMGFFGDLSRFVDIRQFCDEIANEILELNQENLCLLEDAAPDVINNILQDMVENGISLDNPLDNINLECPSRKNYMQNNLVNNTIPSLLNTIVEVVEIDFINSLKSVKAVMQEPSLVSSPGSQQVSNTLEAAGLSPLEEDPELPDGLDFATGATDVLAAIFNALHDIANLIDDIEACDLDLAELFGLPADQTAQVIGTVNDVLQEVIENPDFINGINDMKGAIENIQRARGQTGAPPVVTYQFSQEYKSQFTNYMPSTKIKYDTDEYRVRAGKFRAKTVAPVLPQMTIMGAPPQPSPLGNYNPVELKFTFGPRARQQLLHQVTKATPGLLLGSPSDQPESIKINYRSYQNSVLGKPVDVTLNSSLVPKEIVDEEYDLEFSAPTGFELAAGSDRNVNPYMANFSDNLVRQIRLENFTQPTPEQKETLFSQADGFLFPAAFAGLVESTFDYIRDNGIFDIEKLNALQFFKDNSNCIPDNIADYLDVDGIINSLMEEMLDTLCYDPDKDDLNPMGSKIRDTIRFGMVLLLIQIHIAQFIVKNIFVFSAFDINDILESKTIKTFLSITIRDQVLSLLRSQPVVGQKIVEYFNMKIRRNPVIDQGGMLDSDGNVVFEAERDFGTSDLPAIIEYITLLRIEESKTVVANAVSNSAASSSGASKSFNRALIENALTIQPKWFGGTMLNPARNLYYLRNDNTLIEKQFFNTGNLFGANSNVAALRSLRAKIDGLNIGYGKLVMEKVAVWESVEPSDTAPAGFAIPDVFLDTTGLDYGLELSIFRAAVSDQVSAITKTFGINPTKNSSLRFNNLGIRHRIVYYMPISAHTDSDPLFQDSNTLDASQSFEVESGYVLHRIVLKDMDTFVPVGDRNGGSEMLNADLEAYSGTTLSDSELNIIINNDDYKKFFNKAFNSDLIMLVPILYNLYLTDTHFPKVDGRFQAPKDRILQIFVDTMNSENSVLAPDLTRRAAQRAQAGSPTDPSANLSASSLDFILKALIECPIQILRGLAELVDPHVALSKLIRDASGLGFSAAAKAIDASPALDPLRALAPGVNGEAIMKIIICLLNISLERAINGIAGPFAQVVNDNEEISLIPDISMQGVDFSGTLPGLFMLPPSPLGILYLLLQLVKVGTDQLDSEVGQLDLDLETGQDTGTLSNVSGDQPLDAC